MLNGYSHACLCSCWWSRWCICAWARQHALNQRISFSCSGWGVRGCVLEKDKYEGYSMTVVHQQKEGVLRNAWKHRLHIFGVEEPSFHMARALLRTRTLCVPCCAIFLLYRVFFLSNLLLAIRSVINLLCFYLSILTKSYMFFCQYGPSIFFSITDRNFIDTKL
jgi:hypothetical protein